MGGSLGRGLNSFRPCFFYLSSARRECLQRQSDKLKETQGVQETEGGTTHKRCKEKETDMRNR